MMLIHHIVLKIKASVSNDSVPKLFSKLTDRKSVFEGILDFDLSLYSGAWTMGMKVVVKIKGVCNSSMNAS